MAGLGFTIQPVTSSEAHSGNVVFGAVSGVGAKPSNDYFKYGVLAVAAIALLVLLKGRK